MEIYVTCDKTYSNAKSGYLSISTSYSFIRYAETYDNSSKQQHNI